MGSPRNQHFPSRIEIRVQESLPRMLSTAADRAMTTTSEYARRAIIDQLRRDGFLCAATAEAA